MSESIKKQSIDEKEVDLTSPDSQSATESSTNEPGPELKNILLKQKLRSCCIQ